MSNIINCSTLDARIWKRRSYFDAKFVSGRCTLWNADGNQLSTVLQRTWPSCGKSNLARTRISIIADVIFSCLFPFIVTSSKSKANIHVRANLHGGCSFILSPAELNDEAFNPSVVFLFCIHSIRPSGSKRTCLQYTSEIKQLNIILKSVLPEETTSSFITYSGNI